MIERAPNPDAPDCREEDLFQCVRCASWYPYWVYNYHPRFVLSCPDDVDNTRDVFGNMWACKNCFIRSTLCVCALNEPNLFPNWKG